MGRLRPSGAHRPVPILPVRATRMKGISEFAQNAITWADTILNHRAVVSLIMLYNGIMLLLNPWDSPNGMVQGICIAIAIAAVGIIAHAVTRKMRNIGAYLPAVIALAAAIFLYFDPVFPADILRYLIACTVLAAGVLDLAQAIGLTRFYRRGSSLNDQEAGKTDSGKETEEIRSLVHTTVKGEIDKRIDATQKLFSWFSKNIKTEWMTGIFMTVFGLFLLFFPFIGNGVLAIVSSISMIFISLASLYRIWKSKRTMPHGQPSDAANGHSGKAVP